MLTPVMVGLFFTSMSVLEGGGLEEAKKRISTSWEPTLYKNWGLFSTFFLFFHWRRVDIDGVRSPGSVGEFLRRASSFEARFGQCRLLVLEVSTPLSHSQTTTDELYDSAYLSYANSSSGGVDRELQDIEEGLVEKVAA